MAIPPSYCNNQRLTLWRLGSPTRDSHRKPELNTCTNRYRQIDKDTTSKETNTISRINVS